MITTTLIANGATVYIIGPKQADLDKIANTFNGVGKGKIVGLEGDIRQKVRCLVAEKRLQWHSKG